MALGVEVVERVISVNEYFLFGGIPPSLLITFPIWERKCLMQPNKYCLHCIRNVLNCRCNILMGL